MTEYSLNDQNEHLFDFLQKISKKEPESSENILFGTVKFVYTNQNLAKLVSSKCNILQHLFKFLVEPCESRWYDSYGTTTTEFGPDVYILKQHDIKKKMLIIYHKNKFKNLVMHFYPLNGIRFLCVLGKNTYHHSL